MDDFKSYGFEYGFGGKRWMLNVEASDPEEAKLRLSTCASFGRCIGSLEMTIPASVPAAGWFARLVCWWRNLRNGA